MTAEPIELNTSHRAFVRLLFSASSLATALWGIVMCCLVGAYVCWPSAVSLSWLSAAGLVLLVLLILAGGLALLSSLWPALTLPAPHLPEVQS